MVKSRNEKLQAGISFLKPLLGRFSRLPYLKLNFQSSRGNIYMKGPNEAEIQSSGITGKDRTILRRQDVSGLVIFTKGVPSMR